MKLTVAGPHLHHGASSLFYLDTRVVSAHLIISTREIADQARLVTWYEKCPIPCEVFHEHPHCCMSVADGQATVDGRSFRVRIAIDPRSRERAPRRFTAEFIRLLSRNGKLHIKIAKDTVAVVKIGRRIF